MALEAVVFPEDPLSYSYKDNYLYSLFGGGGSGGGAWNDNITKHSINANWDSVSSSPPSVLQNVKDQLDSHSSSTESLLSGGASFSVPPSSSVEATVTDAATTTGRRKRRRTKSVKNKEEIENQRMTHIAVERNRRKQMNEYLAVLRSLMPPSYVQRGDQASIIGGAINFVKELEQLLQCMKGQIPKKTNHHHDLTATPFAEFFMFPQYSTSATHCNNTSVYPATTTSSSEVMMMMMAMQQQKKSLGVADIEVSLVDSHANMKILSKKQPGLFVKMVVGLQNLGFTILHLNVTNAHDMVLISVSVKVEEGYQMNTVDEIAASVNQLLRTTHDEAALSAD